MSEMSGAAALMAALEKEKVEYILIMNINQIDHINSHIT
jgi:hypothetical protein